MMRRVYSAGALVVGFAFAYTLAVGYFIAREIQREPIA